MKPVQFEAHTLGELETNCYIAWDDDSGQSVIIDPAANGDLIVQRILELQLTPTAIWLTHGHFDHVLGLLEVATAFGVPIWMHSGDKELLARAAASAEYWLGSTPDPVPPATDYWSDQDVLWVGNHQFTVLETPGHTPGSVSLYSGENNLLFSGDTLFKGAIGRTDFNYSSPKHMKQSLQKLAKLPPTTLVLSGHGEPTLIQQEQNILLR